MLWNELRPDRRPELIVRVASEADVVAAVQFARGPEEYLRILRGSLGGVERGAMV